MNKIEELAKSFLKSKYFGPSSPSLLKLIEGYLDDNQISLANLADEMKSWGEFVGCSINFQDEEQFLREVIPIITLEVETRIASGLIDRKHGSKHRAYLYLKGLNFEDDKFGVGLLSLLSDVQQCYRFHWMLENTKSLNLPSFLKNYYLPKDDLVDVTKFDLLSKGFALKNHNIVVYPNLPYPVEHQLLSFLRENQQKVNLLIRPIRIGKYSSYSDIQRVQEARIFGMPFTEQNLEKLIGKAYGVLKYCFDDEGEELLAEMFNVPLKELQYVINKPLSDEHITISIEEVMDIDKNHFNQFSQYNYSCCDDFYMLHRYAHAIISKMSLEISHFDYSYLYYDFDAYSERVDSHIKDKVVSASIKQKLFRIDGSIPFNDFKQILAACFDNDPEIVNLLKGS